MTKPKIIEKNSVNIYDVKKVLDKNKREVEEKKDEELNFRSERTREYTHKFARLTYKSVEELKEKIEKLDIPRLKEEHINKLIDVLPSTEEEVSMVLKQYPITVSKDDMKKIAKTIKDNVDSKYLLE